MRSRYSYSQAFANICSTDFISEYHISFYFGLSQPVVIAGFCLLTGNYVCQWSSIWFSVHFTYCLLSQNRTSGIWSQTTLKHTHEVRFRCDLSHVLTWYASSENKLYKWIAEENDVMPKHYEKKETSTESVLCITITCGNHVTDDLSTQVSVSWRRQIFRDRDFTDYSYQLEDEYLVSIFPWSARRTLKNCPTLDLEPEALLLFRTPEVCFMD